MVVVVCPSATDAMWLSFRAYGKTLHKKLATCVTLEHAKFQPSTAGFLVSVTVTLALMVV